MMASTQTRRRCILLLNGPNLNLLGTREPQIYGSTTLDDIVRALSHRASLLDLDFAHFQSNHEGALIDRIHAARTEGVDAIILNPAGFTHYSVALRDALLGVGIPFLELHLSNTHAREEWRARSFFSDKARAVIMGCGAYGYVAALEFWAWELADGRAKGIEMK